MEEMNNTQGGPVIGQDNRKVKPYSKRIIFFLLILIAGIIFTISFQMEASRKARKTEQEVTYSSSGSNWDFAKMLEEFQATTARNRPPEPIVMPQVVIENFSSTPIEEPKIKSIATPPRPPRLRYFSNQEDKQAASQIKMLNTAAIMNPPMVAGFEDMQPQQQQQPQMVQTITQGGSSSIDPVTLAALAQADPNRQVQKEDFLRKNAANMTSQGYSENLPIPQQFYLELKAGTVIPGMLITGLNSDLPGPVMGQVSENIWDSTHGKHVLIPKGTKILGVYDSQITYGQKRVLVVWNRLILPNGTTLNIAGSPGLDQVGYSGMKGKVDEHWGRMITAALLASLFVTGAEVISPSEDNNRTGNEAKSPGEIASEQAANAILEMSSNLMNKTMNIQPTITIRPGKRFNIFVEKDIVFPEPYHMGLN